MEARVTVFLNNFITQHLISGTKSLFLKSFIRNNILFRTPEILGYFQALTTSNSNWNNNNRLLETCLNFLKSLEFDYLIKQF